MNRRDTVLAILALGAAATSRIALPQARRARIGVLDARQPSDFLPSVMNRLRELGHVEGKNLVVEYRSADEVLERFPALARELIQAKCDLILAIGPEHAARALLDAKAAVPVVILAADYDPVKAGIVSNMQRPGGNVTGMYIPQPALAAKRLEILREIMPRAKRFLVLADPFTKEQLEAVARAAEHLRVALVVETFVAHPYNFESAFARGRTAQVEAVFVLQSPALFGQRSRFVELAIEHRLPLVSSAVAWGESGFLISYGVDIKVFSPAGDIVANILTGKKPGDIAIQQPTRFELMVNMKTAKALGIPIPPSVLVRADKVIE